MFNYDSKRWHDKRKQILKRDGYICQVYKQYGMIREAKIVHHIYPADEFPQWAYQDWNLISVSPAGHNKLEDRVTGKLTKMGQALQDRTVPFVDWRKKPNATAPPGFASE